MSSYHNCFSNTINPVYTVHKKKSILDSNKKSEIIKINHKDEEIHEQDKKINFYENNNLKPTTIISNDNSETINDI